MDFIISASTDVGLFRKNNQDSLSVKMIKTRQGRMVFAVLCDGMGGLSKGEVASASVICAFDHWLVNELPILCEHPLNEIEIRMQWEKIIDEQNKIIKAYGEKRGVKLGTTVVVMLLTQNRYYILNVGDSRAYVLDDSIRQITKDHSLIAREVARGNMTWEEAKVDKRQNVLLQCIGASSSVHPDMFSGEVVKDSSYMICSDGLWHMISQEEIYSGFRPDVLLSKEMMQSAADKLIGLCKQRNEKDNISVVLVRTT